MKSATQALEALIAGNKRFVDGRSKQDPSEHDALRSSVADGQAPFAIILSCSDSRVPAELVFDQGIGDLFVVRVAGNIATDTQIGSIEFAASNFGSRLIVVLGHSGCGAVAATLGHIEKPLAGASVGIQSLVQEIEPAILPVVSDAANGSKEQLLAAAVRANVLATVDRLQQDSTTLSDLINGDGLQVIGAEYSLGTGEVEFFT